MKTCHVCKAVCEDSAELCPVCGADLIGYEEEAEKAREELSPDVSDVAEMENPVLVATIEDVVSAEIFGDILTDNGIMFSCSDEEADGGMRVVFGGGFASVEIYVDNKDFEAAKQLYDEFLESEASFDEEFFIENDEEFQEEI